MNAFTPGDRPAEPRPTGPHPVSASGVPAPAAPASPVARAIRRELALGFGIVALLIGGLGGWAATTELAGAVIGHGTLVVDGRVKQVQARDGGTVAAIAVADGDHVAAGDLLIRLDDTLTRASLAIVDDQMLHLAAQRMRLIGERDDAASLLVPDELRPGAGGSGTAAGLVASEQALFEARRALAASQKRQLHERIAQIHREIEGLTERRDAKTEELGWNAQELDSIQILNRKNLATLGQVAELSRLRARLLGEHGQLVSEIARADGRIAETELQILEIDQARQAEAMANLREIEAKLAELAGQRIAARDRLQQMELRAPQAGIVHDLAVHTVGGVVAPGETVMQIVPSAEALVAEMRLNPADIDQVQPGEAALLRLSAFSQRTTPELAGAVAAVSADVLVDKTSGESWYTARIALDPASVAALGPLKLVPGMPVEVFVNTGPRLALSYFLKPLQDQLRRAFRED
ncbi:HlyD family type I secretion periplasmic adaptor subunit [Ancylobacter lacus]|uniref:HlyD family type I secretion periplasmic adaptor subunit n=1 Tax=Ancylobacter lacus TaxID=2579970 RepID=UPI001BD0B898|nr:HlyD family type I secretion periplasmic adaptor subunit [Ancylobacter lacus]MBS7538039.1 HlyD family type I secretion periplasmic adaptor subunit [Ancylobacter lacus]